MTKELLKNIDDLLISDDFEKLRTCTNKFNIFQVLKLQNAEIRHSNFLGWLLNPYETHLIRDEFLKEFLKIVVQEHSQNTKVSMNIADIVLNNFDDLEVTLEKTTNEGRRIDILLESKKNQFVCVIENKIFSSEWGEQLEHYYDYVNKHEVYSKYKHKLFVYLTPSTEYDSKQLYKNYIQIDYGKICKAIDKILSNKILDDDVKYFIEDYKEMVERDVMGIVDKDIQDLCRKLYRENKAAIDMILQCTKNINEDIEETLKEMIKENENMIIEPSERGWVRFSIKNINYDKLSFAKSDWVNSNKIVMFEFDICNTQKESIKLDIIIRQTNDEETEKRNKLLDLAKEKWGTSTKDCKGAYAHVASTIIVRPSDYYNISLLSKEELKNYVLNKIVESNKIDELINLIEEFEK